MAPRKAPEQHLAVFGESGSGKTVLVSSFFGSHQDAAATSDALFDVVADQPSQSTALLQNYLGMKNSSKVPDATKYSATSYAFAIRLKTSLRARNQPANALRLTWHDYPGEWFEQDSASAEETKRRVDTFRSLLQSDVAVLLVDGQRLLDNEGEEERYLKALLGNMRNVLTALEDDLLENGAPLTRFPRIWLVGLSKSDLLPNFDVLDFRDLVLEKAGSELSRLRETIAGFVEGDEALSVGEDFVLLSSARFEPGRIEVENRVGIDLILPIAAVLRFERFGHWSTLKLLPGKVGERLLSHAGAIAKVAQIALLLARRLPSKFALVANMIDADEIARLAGLAREKLVAINDQAREKHDGMKATLTQFLLDLNAGEQARVLLRSRR